MKMEANISGGFRAFLTIAIPLFLLAWSAAGNAADLDNDGLPDDWESRFSDGGAFSLTRDDAEGDPDGDGLANREEFENGTHPLLADTDGDGLTDREELFVYGTNPLIADTDGGGWPDGREVSAGLNPLNPDDDGDGRNTSFPLALNEGWNLISFPVNLPDTEVGRVLAPIQGKYDIVWGFYNGQWQSYDPDSPAWSTLGDIRPGRGYWVDMNQAALLTVSGPPVTSGIALGPGWNLVGHNFLGGIAAAAAFEGLSGNVTNVWQYDRGVWRVFDLRNPGFSDLRRLEPGFGYWVKAGAAGTLRIP
jgi:hypothetical protein